MAEQGIVRMPELLRLTGISRSSVHRLRARGAFPKPVRLGPRAIGWHRAEVVEWLESRPRANDEDFGATVLVTV